MRLAVISVGVALCGSAAAAPRPRPGKVVRIDRKPRGLAGTPRYCTVSAMDNVAYCVSATPPKVGQLLQVLDNSRVVGSIRLVTVTPITDGCQQSSAWMTQGTLESGDLSTPQGPLIGVLDVPLDTRNAKLVPVDKSPGGHAWGTDTIYAIDNNNDGSADFEFVQFACDDLGNPSAHATGLCSEVWAAQPGRGLEKLRHERVRACY